ncbi:MAG: hypothetical protein SNF33_01130 [Candidatus Algichlamydia australiensis]|nr:hypothetical protein [Chlamydiales bacterium]
MSIKEFPLNLALPSFGQTAFLSWGLCQLGLSHLQSRSPYIQNKIVDRRHTLHTVNSFISYSTLAFFSYRVVNVIQYGESWGVLEPVRKLFCEFRSSPFIQSSYKSTVTLSEMTEKICRNYIGNDLTFFAALMLGSFFFMAVSGVIITVSILAVTRFHTALQDISKKTNSRCLPSEGFEDVEDKISVEWINSPYQNTLQFDHLLSLVATVAFAALAEQKWAFLVLVVAQISAVVTVAKWKTLKFSSKEIELEKVNEGPQKCKFHYIFPVIESASAGTYFCTNHEFPLIKIVESICQQLNRAKIKIKNRHTDHHWEYNKFLYDRISYKVTVENKNLPRCKHECKAPPRNVFSVQFFDRHIDQKRKVSEEWIPAQITVV